jgi:hypothetical protein
MDMFFYSLIFSLVLATEAGAATSNPTAKFVANFVQSVNDRLETVNTERALSGNRPYCVQLSEEQVSDIESLFVYRSLEKVTVGQFVAAAADNLGCYPTFWPSKGHSTIGGVLFNSKAFVMDHLLLRGALVDLAGRTLAESETLNRIF